MSLHVQSPSERQMCEPNQVRLQQPSQHGITKRGRETNDAQAHGGMGRPGTAWSRIQALLGRNACPCRVLEGLPNDTRSFGACALAAVVGNKDMVVIPGGECTFAMPGIGSSGSSANITRPIYGAINVQFVPAPGVEGLWDGIAPICQRYQPRITTRSILLPRFSLIATLAGYVGKSTMYCSLGHVVQIRCMWRMPDLDPNCNDLAMAVLQSAWLDNPFH